ncbi:MAG TPA: type VII secretion-associated serine protease mycosin [Aldersonia sp.]
MRTALAATLALATVLGAGTSAAQGRPDIDPARLPAAAAPAPPEPTEQRNLCTPTAPTVDDTHAADTHATDPHRLDVDAAWQFTRGAGQTVAVIDTGVAHHSRLPGLIAGGDYVGSGDGTDDCDAHGTLVAGIIAAQPSRTGGFTGVAPDARILSLRQSSNAWQVAGRSAQQRPEDVADGYGDVDTMAAAVRFAADHGASVINISEVACSTVAMNDAALGAAVQYAAVVRDVVVVAAAGNTDRCDTPNPAADPLNPGADLWDGVRTVVSPGWYDDYVLTVGSVDASGAPSAFTVAGPWVDVAAPGEDIVSLDPRGTGLTAGTLDGDGAIVPIRGTSFAAPFVAGTAALIRARFPHLSAAQVIARIEASAHAPAEGWNPIVGFGVVDPYAALTAVDEPAPPTKQSIRAQSVALPPAAAPDEPDHRARDLALAGTGAVAIVLLLGWAASRAGGRYAASRAASPSRIRSGPNSNSSPKS